MLELSKVAEKTGWTLYIETGLLLSQANGITGAYRKRAIFPTTLAPGTLRV